MSQVTDENPDGEAEEDQQEGPSQEETSPQKESKIPMKLHDGSVVFLDEAFTQIFEEKVSNFSEEGFESLITLTRSSISPNQSEEITKYLKDFFQKIFELLESFLDSTIKALELQVSLQGFVINFVKILAIVQRPRQPTVEEVSKFVDQIFKLKPAKSKCVLNSSSCEKPFYLSHKFGYVYYVVSRKFPKFDKEHIISLIKLRLRDPEERVQTCVKCNSLFIAAKREAETIVRPVAPIDFELDPPFRPDSHLEMWIQESYPVGANPESTIPHSFYDNYKKSPYEKPPFTVPSPPRPLPYPAILHKVPDARKSINCNVQRRNVNVVTHSSVRPELEMYSLFNNAYERSRPIYTPLPFDRKKLTFEQKKSYILRQYSP